jgi:hypothetical protein
MGLHINVAKSELIQKSSRTCSAAVLAKFKKADLDNATLLDSPPVRPGNGQFGD